MRILAISDTHGNIELACEVIRKCENIDIIVHLGDYQKDVGYIEDLTGKNIISVPGNCDGAYGRDEYKILKTDIGDIYLTHGHMEQVKGGLLNLSYKVIEKNCIAVIYGHTHVPQFLEEDIYFINPGSIGLPIGNRKPSYAIIEICNEAIKCDICYCDRNVVGKLKKNTRGVISQYINYSDRF